jgi:hypothetical protein
VTSKISAQKYYGIIRKKHLVLEGKCFSLYRPSLNLSEEEYNKRLEEIKKMGNMR